MRTMKKRMFIVCGAGFFFSLAFFSACDRITPGRFEYRGYAFGSTYHILLGDSTANANTAKELQSYLTALEKKISQWQKESETARFNAWSSTENFPVTAETTDILEKALFLSDATSGAFDPTIGRVLTLWGFTGKGFRGVPNEAAVRTAQLHSGFQKLRVRKNVLRKSDPQLELNMDGISQGYAADAASAFLETRGVHVYITELGGEIRAGRGNHGGWTVPIEAADKKRRAIRLESRGLATSARDRNFVEEGGKRFGHIIDPATGRPSDNGILQATAVCPDAATADGLATALLVMQKSTRDEAMRRLKGCDYLLLTSEGKEILSPGLKRGEPGPDGQAIYWPVM